MYTNPRRVQLGAYRGLGLSYAFDIPKTVGMDTNFIFGMAPMNWFVERFGLTSPGPGFRFLGTREERAIGVAGSRYWNVYVNPDTGEWVRQLFTTWGTLHTTPSQVPVGAPSPQYPHWVQATEAARRAPGALGGGAWMKEPVVWLGTELYDTAAWRLNQKVLLVDDPVVDTLKLVNSMDAGGPPVIESLGFIVEPLSNNWREWEIARIQGTLEPLPPVPPKEPLPEVYFVDGKYVDGSGKVLTSAEVAKIFPSPTVSPTVAEKVAGTTAAIVTTYGGGPGTENVAPTTGLEPVALPLTPAETTELVKKQVEEALAASGGSLPASTQVQINTGAGPMLVTTDHEGQVVEATPTEAGFPWWLVAVGVGVYALSRKKRAR